MGDLHERVLHRIVQKSLQCTCTCTHNSTISKAKFYPKKLYGGGLHERVHVQVLEGVYVLKTGGSIY